MEDKSKEILQEPIGKLLLNYSLPAIIGMMVMAFYNLVDTIFVGIYVGQLGIGGVAVVMPYNSLVLAVTQFVAIGSASIISRSIGQGDKYKINQTFNVTYVLITIISILFTFLGMTFIDDLIYLFGATESIYPYAYEYLSITILGSFASFFIMTSNNLIRSEGNAKIAMLSMLLSALLNIILDAVLIVGFGMGMKGAAWATVLAKIVAGVFVLFYFISEKSTFKFSIKYIYLDFKLLTEIFSIGSAAFARQMGNSFMNIVVNQSLRIYGGDLMIAAYGIIIRLLLFTSMPLFGFAQGLMPVLGVNYGAGEYKRSVEAINKSAGYATIFSTMAFLMFMIFPKFLVGLFSTETDLIEYAAYALGIITLGFASVGYQTIGSALFQSLGRGTPALFLSLLRQVLLLIPLVYFLPMFFGTDGILYSFVISDLLAFIITWFVVRFEKKRLHNLVENV